MTNLRRHLPQGHQPRHYQTLEGVQCMLQRWHMPYSLSLGHDGLGGVHGTCGRKVCTKVMGSPWAGKHTDCEPDMVTGHTSTYSPSPVPSHQSLRRNRVGLLWPATHLQLFLSSLSSLTRTGPFMHCRKCLMTLLPQWSTQLFFSASSQDTSGTWSYDGCCRPQGGFQVSGS